MSILTHFAKLKVDDLYKFEDFYIILVLKILQSLPVHLNKSLTKLINTIASHKAYLIMTFKNLMSSMQHNNDIPCYHQNSLYAIKSTSKAPRALSKKSMKNKPFTFHATIESLKFINLKPISLIHLHNFQQIN